VLTEVIADPDFQFRKWVRNLAEKAGFIERASYGNSLSYTLVFEKPELLA
jgi:phage anti-repressor protein